MFEKKKLRLRKVTKKDLKLIRDWRNSSSIRSFNTQFVLLNLNYQNLWFNEISEKNTQRIMFMIELNGMPIGICGLIHLDKTNKHAEVAIIIGETELHGKGFGTFALSSLIDYGFKKLNLHRISAEIFEYNTNSIKLFKKLNFKYELTFYDRLWRKGKWWNVYQYSLLKNEYVPKTNYNLLN